MPSRSRPLQLASALALAAVAALAACDQTRTLVDPNAGTGLSRCTACHGNPARVAIELLRAAPPKGLRGGTQPGDLDVGAHQAHLAGKAFSLGIACQECHPALGERHPDGELHFTFDAPGNLAPGTRYDTVAHSCATSYCHDPVGTGRKSPAWNEVGALSCGGCHGLPPAPSTGHPSVSSDLTGCAACHPGTMKGDGTLDLAGGKHVDGIVEAIGHGDYSSPAVHGPRALDHLGGVAGALDCTSCHGASYDGGTAPSCNACHATAGWAGWQANCSFCHGTRSGSTQAGYDVAVHPTWAAPPDAIAQRLDPSHAAVPARTGAHQAHLTGATSGGLSFAPSFTCQTCHAVPTELTHIGGSTSRATVALSGAGQASFANTLGSYDPATGTCTTYCHGVAPSPAWATTGLVCGSCHALPPSTSSGHPAVPSDLTGCNLCHPDTMNGDGTLNLAGGKHLDGVVEVSGGHGDYSSPAVHGPKFLDYLAGASTLDCKLCHGASYDGGIGPSCNACHASAGWTGWQSNCSFCHGTRNATTQGGYAVASHPTWAAPPDSIAQRLDPAHAAVPARTGAHQAHLTGATSGGLQFAAAFTCQTCHAVPSDLSHIGGSASRATVALSGAGQASLSNTLGSYDPATGTCATYCHGSVASPAWSATGLVCGACHALPPSVASGHPNIASDLTLCSGCHPGTVNADGTINPAGGKHLNGVIDASGAHGDFTSPATHGPQFFAYQGGVQGSLDCRSCHGQDFNGGFGPSCTACHVAAGWTGWQTNCSFCHGARNATTQAGYDVAAKPTWSAPPDAVAQRLDPSHTAIPARTGAHQAHLLGKGSDGNSYAPPLACATCHAVPVDQGHAVGAAHATVTLTGSGSLPASLGSYAVATGTCTTYCHGSTLANDLGSTSPPPAWSGGVVGCASCHGNPPLSGQHDFHVNQLGWWCADCHAGTVDYGSVVVSAKHVDGLRDVQFYSPGSTWDGNNCTSACHDSGDSRSWR